MGKQFYFGQSTFCNPPILVIINSYHNVYHLLWDTYSIYKIYPLSFWKENEEVHSFDLSCTQNYIFAHHFHPSFKFMCGHKSKSIHSSFHSYLFLFSLFPNIRKVFSFLSLPLPSTIAKHSLREPLKRECQNSKLFCEKKQKTKKTKSR